MSNFEKLNPLAARENPSKRFFVRVEQLIADLPLTAEKKTKLLLALLALMLFATACTTTTELSVEPPSVVEAFGHSAATIEAMENTYERSGLKFLGTQEGIDKYRAGKPISLDELQEALQARQRCTYACGNHITAIYPDGRCEVFFDTDLYKQPSRKFPKKTEFYVLSNSLEQRDPQGWGSSGADFEEFWRQSQEKSGGKCEVAVPDPSGPTF